MAYYARDVQHAFPDDQHLVDLAISSYLAVAIVNSAGEIIGHVCVMDAHPLKHGQHATGIMNVFAARAGAELERLHTTAALQQSEARQALILNSLPIAFYTSNSSGDGGSTWVSENLERLTGFASCRFLDDPGFWAARLHSEDRERVLSEVKRGRDVGTVSVEYRWQIADGSYRWYLDNAVYTRDVHGTLQELIGARIDITHRKRTEEALRESETRFKAFMDHNPAVIFMKDEEGRHVYVNREFERVLGLEEWVGKTDEELWSHDMAKQFRRNDQEVVTSDATIDVVETTVSRTGVRQFWRVIKFPIADVAGKRYLGGIAVDMTDRKQVEEALRESQERLALCIRGSDVGIWDWDMRREVVYFSPRWKQMLGYEDAEIQNRFEEWEARIHPDDRGPALSMLRSYVEGRQPHYHLEHRMQHKDGTYRWILSHGACLRDCDGTPFRMAGSHLDITERKQIEEELKSSLTRLRSLSGRLETVREEERRRIARELHDEFGVGLTCLKMDLSRLTVFIGHTGALEKGRQIDEKIRSMQDFIDVTIGSIQRIVTELRPAILDDLGLAAAIEWQAQDFQRRTGIPCTLQWREDHLDMDAECATAVFRICQEALTNVARHANATTVAIRLEARQGRLLLEVRDNGCGIAEEQIADPRSLGLLGMRERAESIGGLVTIAGRREAGTAVTLHVQCLRPSSLVEGS
jgi:PAS domain S-box-containing protein